MKIIIFFLSLVLPLGPLFAQNLGLYTAPPAVPATAPNSC